MSSRNRNSTMSQSQRGKKGASVRWGKDYQDDNDDDISEDYDTNNSNNRRNNSSSSQSKGGRNNRGVPKDGEPHKPLSTVGFDDDDDYNEEDDDIMDEGGSSSSRRNAHTDFQSGKNPNRQNVGKRVANERGHQALSNQGKKGGRRNAGIHASGGYDDDYNDMTSYLNDPSLGVPAKDPRRVQAGKKAANTRGHEALSEQGQLGGRSRAGSSQFGGGYVGYDEGFEDYGSSQGAKNPNRIQGGKRAAQGRSHEEFVKLGKMGAAARWGKGGGHNMQDEDDDDNEDEQDDYNDYSNNDDEDNNYGSSNRGSRGQQGRQGGQGGQGGGRRGRHLSHEEAVELGHKGAEARWGKQSSNMSDSPSQSKKRHLQYKTNEDEGYDDGNTRHIRHETSNQRRIIGTY